MRSPDAILDELRTLHAMQAEAQDQLRSVRREQAKLVDHEALLLGAIDGRLRKIDRALEEYTVATNQRGKALT